MSIPVLLVINLYAIFHKLQIRVRAPVQLVAHNLGHVIAMVLLDNCLQSIKMVKATLNRS